jgi:putative RNA 2'-phosphotransferase
MKIKDISRFLSLVLRHQPEKIGITLDKNGWASVKELLNKMKISQQQLDDVFELQQQPKQKIRFQLNEDGSKIRAMQGHSLGDVDLELPVAIPPAVLYHGTPDTNKDSILSKGLVKDYGNNNRHDVHLSIDTETALDVAKRRKGDPVIFVVDTQAMVRDGYTFKLADNGVWLTDHVPAAYLSITTNE